MRWIFLLLSFLLLSCEGLTQAPPAIPGSGIPVKSSTPAIPGSGIPVKSSPDPAVTPAATAQENPDGPSSASLPTDRQWGLVRCSNQDNWNTNTFNEQIRLFLSTSTNPNTINFYVKCNWTEEYKDWQGGFFIKGNVNFENGVFNPQSTSQNLTISPSSYIELHIVSHRGINSVEPIKMNIVSQRSRINSNVQLVFKDDKGEISLTGSVKMNDNIKDFTISGDISFTNLINWDGRPEITTGPLGWFEIPACSFLQCSHSSTTKTPGL